MKSTSVRTPHSSATKSPANTGKPPHAPGSAPNADDTDLPLPHERDESVGSTNATPDPVIDRARKDLEEGQVDTDMRSTPGLDAERRREILKGDGGDRGT